MAGKHFTPASFRFLKELKENNNRPWFQKNKARYENDLKAPALAFVEDFEGELAKISPHFHAGRRSFFRIYRDTRFSKDKSPYKTYAGIQFRHEACGSDVHAPGFYLHLEPRHSFVGCGMWQPDSKSLLKIRESIVEEPAKWKRAKNAKRFAEAFELEGDSLKTAPRGFDRDHPLIEDLRRKDFIGATRLSQKAVTDAGFLGEFSALCRAAAPFQRWLCESIGVAY
jgi:uncharacterized protein (TIGR02453 family)